MPVKLPQDIMERLYYLLTWLKKYEKNPEGHARELAIEYEKEVAMILRKYPPSLGQE